MNKVKLISFDLDDTLYDNRPVISRAETVFLAYLKAKFESQNKQFSVQKYTQIKQKLLAGKEQRFEDMSLLRQAVLAEFCSGLNETNAISSKAFELFINARSNIDIPLAIENMLNQLSKHFILVSVTNGNCDPKQLSVGQLFADNYSPSLKSRAKPHPQMLQQVLADYELSLEELIHIGDSVENDGVAASVAGVAFYHFSPFDGSDQITQQCQRLLQYLI